MSALIRTVNVCRYATPLREGGSLPAIAEADDGFLYVVKFRGAGQGPKALIADLLGGEIARACGFKVPEIVFATLDESFGRTEPDEEIQNLLKASVGLNLGLHYLSGAITYDPAVTKLTHFIASKIVWLDAFLMNVDRTARNTNMLTWRSELWLIDHGASLYFHHRITDYKDFIDLPTGQAGSTDFKDAAENPFPLIKDHVLLWKASELDEVDKTMKRFLTEEKLKEIVQLIPNEWIKGNQSFNPSIPLIRDLYLSFLIRRISHSSLFINQAIHARESLI